jgi:hypothetical protein
MREDNDGEEIAGELSLEQEKRKKRAILFFS